MSNTLTPLSSHYNGYRLNSPNDLAVHFDGSIFFTDPPYGLNDQHATRELSFNGIFRLNSKGELFLPDSNFARSNGITFSPDGSILYVSDSEARKIYKWHVMEDSVITGKEEFTSIQVTGYADGIRTDSIGFL
jgi:sugar lactone lactonase YvrE